MRFGQMILIVTLLALSTGVQSVSSLQAVAREIRKPNIVFVLFDDMGYGQPPSFRPSSEFKTPHIDRLAREGMRFTDAHSAAANCTPTRYGLLTGRYPSRIGQFGVLTTYSAPIIPTDRLTVASFLKRHGYKTACIGKWHLGLNWIDEKPGQQDKLPIGAKMVDGPNAIGFDYFYGFTHARNIGSIIEQDAVVANVTAVENQPLMIAKAVEYLEQRADFDEPFFLYFPMCPPHKPIEPAADYIGKSGVKGKEALYGDWIYQGDDMLGQILATLDRTGQSEHTLVVATGDNGAAGRPYPPFRAAKSSIYEGGHREPFVARWPGKITPGAVSDQTICLNDFLATCADLLGDSLPSSAGEDSVSILPCLLGNDKGSVREAIVHQAPGGLAIRQEKWKLIFHRDGKRELFDLGSDIGEENNVLQQNPAVAKRLTDLMQNYIDRGRSTPGPDQQNEFELTIDFSQANRKPKD